MQYSMRHGRGARCLELCSRCVRRRVEPGGHVGVTSQGDTPQTPPRQVVTSSESDTSLSQLDERSDVGGGPPASGPNAPTPRATTDTHGAPPAQRTDSNVGGNLEGQPLEGASDTDNDADDGVDDGSSHTRASQGVVFLALLVAWLILYWVAVLLASPEHVDDVEDDIRHYWVSLAALMVAAVSLFATVVCCFACCRTQRLQPCPHYEPLPQDSPETAQSVRPFAGIRDKGVALYTTCKRHQIGIFYFDRFLKVQDVLSDAAVTFCHSSIPLCSLCLSNGLWWGEDWWWAHFSLFLLLSTYVLLWILTAPIFTMQLEKAGLPDWCCIALWVMLGLPTVAILDLYMCVRYPFREPEEGWLGNVCRLQKFTEAVLEAPLQSALQTWMFLSKTFFEITQEFQWPWMLMFSAMTSFVSFVTTLLDVQSMADAQGISFWDALRDLFLIGLGWNAPKLHYLRLHPEVTFESEGPLTHKQCGEIAKVAESCVKNLTKVTFGLDNNLGDEEFFTLLGAVPDALVVKSKSFDYNGPNQHLVIHIVKAGDWEKLKNLEHLHTLEVCSGNLERSKLLVKLITPWRLQVLKLGSRLHLPTHEPVGCFIHTYRVCVGVFQPAETVAESVCIEDDTLNELCGGASKFSLRGEAEYCAKDCRLTIRNVKGIMPHGWRRLQELQQLQELVLCCEEQLSEQEIEQVGSVIRSVSRLQSLSLKIRHITNGGLQRLILVVTDLPNCRSVRFEIVDQLKYEEGVLHLRANSAVVSTEVGSHLHAVQVVQDLVRPSAGLWLGRDEQLLQELRNSSWGIHYMDEGCHTHYDAGKRVVCIHDGLSMGAVGCFHLRELRCLKGLHIGSKNGVGPKGCEHLKTMEQLTCLRLGDHNGITAEGCKHLKDAKSLTILEIGKDSIGKEGCQYLKDLQKLTELTIGSGNKIGREGCEHLKDLHQLTSLEIKGGNEIGPEGCKHLKELQQLTILKLGRDSIGPEGCSYLKGLQRLTSLSIGWDNRIGQEGIRHLKGLPLLEEFTIGAFNNIGEDGCRHLQELPRLKRFGFCPKGNKVAMGKSAAIDSLEQRGVDAFGDFDDAPGARFSSMHER